MAKKFSELRAKMSPEAQEWSALKARILDLEGQVSDLQAEVSKYDAMRDALTDYFNDKIDRVTGCPHGQDRCACAISSRHEWMDAFCEERTARLALENKRRA
jgi:hypothetical protein